jgi:ribonuclease T2
VTIFRHNQPRIDHSIHITITGTPRDSLWKHEWLKHGTCAMVLPPLSDENKYFGQGLVWLQQFSMSALLSKANVLPDTNLTVIDIHRAVKSTLNRNPSIHCIREPKTGDIYLSEIRICFSKTLELIDCDGVVKPLIDIPYQNEQIITNCYLDIPIYYPSVVPPRLIKRNESVTPSPFSTFWNLPFVNIYKLIQIVKWFTL